METKNRFGWKVTLNRLSLKKVVVLRNVTSITFNVDGMQESYSFDSRIHLCGMTIRASDIIKFSVEMEKRTQECF